MVGRIVQLLFVSVPDDQYIISTVYFAFPYTLQIISYINRLWAQTYALNNRVFD